MSRDQKTTPQPSRGIKPFKRPALLVSLVFHILLLAGLACWIVSRRPANDEAPLAQVGATTDSPPPGPSRRRAEPSPDVSSEQVANTLKRNRDLLKATSADEKLSALEKQAADLEGLATSESIDEIASKFHTWKSTQARASEPAEEMVDGPFDFETAQIHEVLKVTDEAGEVKYTSVLVDAAGRTCKVDIPTPQGEQAYRTMQTLKRYPLTDKVYREIAMGLLDRALAKQAVVKQAVPQNEQGQPPREGHRNPFDGPIDNEPSP